MRANDTRKESQKGQDAIRRKVVHAVLAGMARQAREEKAEIFWGDEMGARSDHQTETTWGLKGQTPVVKMSGARFGCNMVSMITNNGKLSFMVFSKKFTSEVFFLFLERMSKHYEGRKIYLIIDRHPVHTSKRIVEWFSKQQEWLNVYYLPSYSPELNPDELLNNTVKGKISCQDQASNSQDLQKQVRGCLRSIQRSPAIVKNFFEGKFVSYAKDGAA